MKVLQPIECQVTLNASIEDTWRAWTTQAGVVSFFAPAANVDPRPGGVYEILFNLSAPPGEQGSEGMHILSMQPHEFFSFTWNAPPHLPEVRGQMTFVEIRLSRPASGQTLVTLRHSGWGTTTQWIQAHEYFSRAWPVVVLPRLKHSLELAPIDWSNPPELSTPQSNEV